MDSAATTTTSGGTADLKGRSLLNKVAVITGSSAGIGAAIAIELGSRGAKVVLNYPHPTLKGEAEKVTESIASDWVAVEADLFGTIDILVNNAGRVLMSPLAVATLQEWQTLIDTNARGMFLVTQAALPHLTPKDLGGGARIINIISAASTDPENHQTVYSASKAAGYAMAKCWASELPPQYGCTVNSVAPGPILTEASKAANPGMEEMLESMFDSRTPVSGSYGYPKDVSWAVAFLAEERSGWINGACINVSGGLIRT
ncbi:short chain type dehydrogenase [Ilyonectria sp. MPI-CAGE-AT-0026]|nr:short chain type dehydrogenase [Ilyonectria sp. MPI-CAGE-AT-0026]